MSELPDVIQEVDAYRSVARRIARNTLDEPLGHRDQLVALVNLVERARREATLVEFIERAIWEESEGVLWQREPLKVPADPVERALRRLAGENRERCPTCLRPTPSETEFAIWEARRAARRDEFEAREGAIS